MNHFDDELRKAMGRVDPPEGFAERVLARVAEERAKPRLVDRLRSWFGMPGLRLAAAVAMIAVIVAGVGYEREVRRRAEGERAKEQVMLALRITADKIQVAQRGVERWEAFQNQ